jgi:hypothetical protein
MSEEDLLIQRHRDQAQLQKLGKILSASKSILNDRTKTDSAKVKELKSLLK